MNPGLFVPLWAALGVDGLGAYASFVALIVLFSIPLIGLVTWRFGVDPRKATVVALSGFYLGAVFSRLTFYLTAARSGAVASEVEARGWLGFVGSLFVAPWTGGHVYYGGLLGALLTVTVASRVLHGRASRAATLRVLDGTVFPLFLISALGRLGCYFQGCCFGRIDEHWGVVFPAGSAAAAELAQRGLLRSPLEPTPPLVPTQLIEVVTSGTILVFLLVSLRFAPRLRPGFFAWHALLFHAVARFHIEWLRFDIRGGWWVFSTSQWIALLVAAVLIAVRATMTGGWRARPT